MHRLKIAALAAALLAGAPLAAQTTATTPAAASARQAEMETVAKKMEDPGFQKDMATMMSAMMQAMLSMKVGPIAEAAKKIDPKADMGKVDPNATVGDLAAKGDPDYAKKMSRNSEVMAKSMGVMTRAMVDMMPAMMEAAKKMEAGMEKAGGKVTDNAIAKDAPARDVDPR